MYIYIYTYIHTCICSLAILAQAIFPQHLAPPPPATKQVPVTMARQQSRLTAVLALALVLLFAQRCFVPAPQANGAALLRGSAALAAATAPLAATAADELIDYNYAGEWTPLFITSYLGLTLAYTGVAFVSYLVLTKLKII